MLARGAVRLLGPAAAVLALDAVVFGTAAGPVGHAAGFALGPLAVLVAFLLVFYRDPERAPGVGIVSAADGRVRAVERVGDRWLVSVFMNVTDVHVNRFPLDARVEAIERGGEGARPAYRPDAERNVQLRYRLTTPLGPVEVVQITGAVARRLVPFVAPGAAARKGDRLGMIVLGSRVDVFLPASRLRPTVAVGDRVRAGTTTIAREAA